MGSVPNTVRRGAVFHFRRAVPEDLRDHFKRAELTCSLRTADVGVARRLSRALYVCTEDLFDGVRADPMLSDQDIQALVKDFYGFILDQEEAARLMRDEPLSEERRLLYVEHYRELAERSRIDLASSAFGTVRQIASTMLARRFGPDAKIEKSDARRVSHAMLRAGIEVAEALKARAEGDFNYEPKDKLLSAALKDDRPTSAEERPSEPPAPSVVPGPPFSEEAENFRLARIKKGSWEKQTALQARKTYELFVEFFGDRPLALFTRRDAARFKELLEDLPANYGKAAEYRGLKAVEIVERSKSKDVRRLSSSTARRHFNALGSLWKFAIEQGRADTDIFAGFKFVASKRARDQRQMWEKSELQELFASSLWTGCQSRHRRSKPGSVILRDEKFWLPLIAVFSGMRQEEICQLRVADVREVEGIWIFDLNTRSGQQLKNANAIRQVPIHSELIRIGLLAYAEEQRASGKELLFPNLKPGGADDRLGHNYSKWFSRYRRETGLFVPGRDFHSFRHSATTFLARAKVPYTVIDSLTGHATEGETARYDKGLEVAQLKEAIEKIDIGVDLSALYSPVEP